MLKAQQEQQRLLSNQSAENAARQFGAANEQQTNQYMAGLAANMEQFNAQQSNAMEQFNAQQANAAAARAADRGLDASKFNAQQANAMEQFNKQMDFQKATWEANNAAAVEASNVQWRRQANTANTVAINAMNQFNAQNAYNMSSQAQAFMWQSLRDEADFNFRRWDNDQQRKASLIMSALGNEGVAAEDGNWQTELNLVLTMLENIFPSDE